MFSPGQILYFSPFFFKNGNTSKNKYFIILKIAGRQLIVASLPTRTCKAPLLITTSHGCNNDNDRMFNCYVFSEGKIIADSGFAFPLPTYIYGNEIEDYDLSLLQDIYRIEGVDYEIKGTLLQNEYDAILQCMRQSSSVKRRIKKLL